jgi:hypothetical protein
MHWRNKGVWLANNAFENKPKPPIKRKSVVVPKPKTPSPSPRTKRATHVRGEFALIWKVMNANNRQVVRNYIAAYKSPKTTKNLNSAKRSVNALKTIKARKEYKKKHQLNMSAENFKQLRKYIALKNATQRAKS